LRDEDIDRIVETCCQFGEAEGYSKVVILDEIAQNSYNLNIARYLPIATNEEEIDLNEVQAMLEAVRDERENLEEVLQSIWEALRE